jgi:hypothetical protein
MLAEAREEAFPTSRPSEADRALARRGLDRLPTWRAPALPVAVRGAADFSPKSTFRRTTTFHLAYTGADTS